MPYLHLHGDAIHAADRSTQIPRRPAGPCPRARNTQSVLNGTRRLAAPSLGLGRSFRIRSGGPPRPCGATRLGRRSATGSPRRGLPHTHMTCRSRRSATFRLLAARGARVTRVTLRWEARSGAGRKAAAAAAAVAVPAAAAGRRAGQGPGLNSVAVLQAHCRRASGPRLPRRAGVGLGF
jgi:hypothetical protein